MYRYCIYCAGDLGANRAIEEFPIGRRISYDIHKGRLWVVCHHCERWNLSPIEERWEALETIERVYRDTRTRFSTEQIGLAKLSEGLELIRIGRPQRPEFAAWRYAGRFSSRRRKQLRDTGLLGGSQIAAYTGMFAASYAGGAILAGAAAIGLPMLLYAVMVSEREHRRLRRTQPVRIAAASGKTYELQWTELGGQKIRPSDEHDGGWYLELAPWLAFGEMAVPEESKLSPDDPPPPLVGAEAVSALSLIVPHVNRAGGRPRDVQTAVRLLDDVGSPAEYLRTVEGKARSLGRGYGRLGSMPIQLRLGLEMAAHEEQERDLLRNELELLEQAWMEAEALAAIVDDLLLPAKIKEKLGSLRRRIRGSKERSTTGAAREDPHVS